MYEKLDLKLMLDVYLEFEGKDGLRKKIKALIEILGYETVEEFLKDEKYITEAVKLKDLELAKLLYINGSVIPNSLLKIAIDNHDEAMLDFLLNIGIDINERIYDEGKSYEPIAYLAKSMTDRRYEIAEKMLKLGANPNAKIGKYTILEYYLSSISNAHFYLSYNSIFISLLLKNGAIITDEYPMVIYNVAYRLDLETFKILMEGKKHNIIPAIDGAIVGNKKETLEYILSKNMLFATESLDIAIGRYAGIDIFKIILKFDIPKIIINMEIEHLKELKSSMDIHKYHQILSLLKKAKRKK